MSKELKNHDSKKRIIPLDEKIQELIDWGNQYPKLRGIYSARVPIDIIREYSKSEENTKELVAQYRRICMHYKYIRMKKSLGELSEEQEYKCRKGKIGGRFNKTTEVEELARKYRISVDKIVYILKHYKTMDEFIMAYRTGNLSKEDLWILRENLKRHFDINLKGNKGYDTFIEAIYREINVEIGNSYITEENLNFYNKAGLDEALKTLLPREVDFLKKRFRIRRGETTNFRGGRKRF